MASRVWQHLLAGFPWFQGEGNYPIAAYSEFMPPPRLGRLPYGPIDGQLFMDSDPFGWHITEYEEALALASRTRFVWRTRSLVLLSAWAKANSLMGLPARS